jgi:hypothetical protein
MNKLDQRPKSKGLIVPYMVDATVNPIDFKLVDAEHVKRCTTHKRCGICGGKIRGAEFAFIGPDDGRTCFADPWMHLACARLAMGQCPFLAARSDWREEKDNPLLKTYAHNMRLFVAPASQVKAHRDHRGSWHFQMKQK